MSDALGIIETKGFAAAAGESEPCVAFSPLLAPKSLRMVPSAAMLTEIVLLGTVICGLSR